MAKKKSENKPRGHYCKVCGEHKANEKFSGRGHNAHICKKCSTMPVAERNEEMTLRKIEGMAFRYLSESEIKWLRGKMSDARPTVREVACETHAVKFPRYERNMVKKGLTAFSLELFIRGNVWDEYGDEVLVHSRVFMEHTGTVRRIDYDAPEHERETEVDIGTKEARTFLKSLIHEHDALFWGEDLSDAGPGELDPYLDILPEYRPDFGMGDFDSDDEDEDSEPEAPAEGREPIWSLLLELNNGEDKAITFYNQMHDAPQALFLALSAYFEPDDEYDEEWEEYGTVEDSEGK